MPQLQQRSSRYGQAFVDAADVRACRLHHQAHTGIRELQRGRRLRVEEREEATRVEEREEATSSDTLVMTYWYASIV